MVYLDNLKDYADDATSKCAVSITPTYEMIDGGLFNTKLVETYNLSSDDEATRLIDSAKQNNDFFSVTKKYKQPKYNKEGELMKEGHYIIKITYKHDYKEND